MLGQKQCFWIQKTRQYWFLSTLPVSLGLGLLLSTGQAFAEELHDAAKSGDLDTVKKLLDQGAPVDGQDREAETPLQLATSEGHIAVVEQLIASGADVNAGRGAPPLHRALQSGAPEIIELLLTYGADVNESHSGHTALYLVPWMNSRWMNSIKKREESALLDRGSIAELLLRFGAEVDAQNLEKTFSGPYKEDYDVYSATALHAASMRGEADIVAVLLKHNANPHARVQLKDRVRRPLPPSGELYFDSGLVPTLSGVFDKFGNPAGMTPLHFAAYSPKGGAVAQLLLDRGAEIDAYSRSGRTPLHLCVQHNNTIVAAQLLAHGADVNAEDNEGKLPLDFAAQYTDVKLITLLREYGAKEGISRKF